jgi:hypothetical protein
MLKEGMWNLRSLNRRAYIAPWMYKLGLRLKLEVGEEKAQIRCFEFADVEFEAIEGID